MIGDDESCGSHAILFGFPGEGSRDYMTTTERVWVQRNCLKTCNSTETHGAELYSHYPHWCKKIAKEVTAHHMESPVVSSGTELWCIHTGTHPQLCLQASCTARMVQSDHLTALRLC